MNPFLVPETMPKQFPSNPMYLSLPSIVLHWVIKHLGTKISLLKSNRGLVVPYSRQNLILEIAK